MRETYRPDVRGNRPWQIPGSRDRIPDSNPHASIQYHDAEQPDVMFHKFQGSKANDFSGAQKAFQDFKTGLERHIVSEGRKYSLSDARSMIGADERADIFAVMDKTH